MEETMDREIGPFREQFITTSTSRSFFLTFWQNQILVLTSKLRKYLNNYEISSVKEVNKIKKFVPTAFNFIFQDYIVLLCNQSYNLLKVWEKKKR